MAWHWKESYSAVLLVHSTIPFVAFFKINYRCFFSIYSLCDLKHPWEWKSLAAQTTKILSANIGQSLPTTSLCSKGFSVISEQTKTDEWRRAGFSVLAARKMEREIPHSLLLAPSFARSLTLVPRSLLTNRTETLFTRDNLQRKFLYRFTRQRPASGNEGNKCLKYFSTDSPVRAARI